jgi:hypothetical protein
MNILYGIYTAFDNNNILFGFKGKEHQLIKTF